MIVDKWKRKDGYIVIKHKISSGYRLQYIHRKLNTNPSKVIHHIDGNPSNNVRANRVELSQLTHQLIHRMNKWITIEVDENEK